MRRRPNGREYEALIADDAPPPPLQHDLSLTQLADDLLGLVLLERRSISPSGPRLNRDFGTLRKRQSVRYPKFLSNKLKLQVKCELQLRYIQLGRIK